MYRVLFHYFKNLKNLICKSTRLTKLDLRDSKNLFHCALQMGCYLIGGLMLGEKPNLTFMDCHNNKKLANIDLNGCTALTRFNCK